jgi:hypothetical protein
MKFRLWCGVKSIVGTVVLVLNLLPSVVLAAAQGASAVGDDMSIESMRSQEFSVAIFYFLIMAIFVFVGIVFMFMFKGRVATLKTGEKWLFGWLLFGVVMAIGFGAAQMLDGYLF